MDLIGDRTLRDLLEERVALYGDREVLVFEDRDGAIERFSYRQFDARVNQVANGLLAEGIRADEKVVVHLPNSPAFLLTWFALAKIGAVMVPTNTANTAAEMEYVLTFSDATTVVTEASFLAMFEQTLPRCPGVRRVFLARCDAAPSGTRLWDALWRERSTNLPPIRFDNEATVEIPPKVTVDGYQALSLKGKKVVAGARIPADMLFAYMRITPKGIAEVWHHTVIGHLQANAIGFNAHYANGLTALFIACGQDVANVANAAVGITDYEVTDDGDLYASVTLPSLTVATVGGGTGLGTSRECLDLLGCRGAQRAAKLAEIVAATVLAGEISMAAAIGTGEFVSAHEEYGRNRPLEDRG